MPNWCENEIKIEHDDPKMIQKFVKSYNEDKVCGIFIPEPDYSKVPVYEKWDPFMPRLSPDMDLSKPVDPESAWYEWRNQNWGIKWDFGRKDNDVIDVDSETTEVTVYFLTPWGPPKKLYEHLTEELGFRIHAEFYEFGIGFFGVFETKDKQTTVEMDLKSLEEFKPVLPLSYEYIKEGLEEMLEDEEEEEVTDTK
jgi:hypothetical protein